MKQEPNPIDDVELERFSEWLFDLRNSPELKGKARLPGLLTAEELKTIFLEGLQAWHRWQITRMCPAEFYKYHSDELKNVLDMLYNRPQFRQTCTMR